MRSVAGQDLREARNWDELERRLERHGLHVEPRGRGMVLSDGRQQVKASAVDRSASRGGLEKRFGMTLQEHLRERGVQVALRPEVRQVVEQVRHLERREWLSRDLAATTQARDALRARLDGYRWARERATAAERTMDRALEVVFRDPRAARSAIETRAAERGPERTLDELHTRPERFGELRSAEARRLLRWVPVGNAHPSQERIASAAEAVREALHARAAVPHERLVEITEREHRAAEQRVQAMERRLSAEPERSRVLARIGAAALQVDRAGGEELREVIGNARFQTVVAARQAMRVAARRLSRPLVPEPAREAVAWIASPEKQESRAVLRAFRDVAFDRDRERGLR